MVSEYLHSRWLLETSLASDTSVAGPPWNHNLTFVAGVRYYEVSSSNVYTYYKIPTKLQVVEMYIAKAIHRYSISDNRILLFAQTVWKELIVQSMIYKINSGKFTTHRSKHNTLKLILGKVVFTSIFDDDLLQNYIQFYYFAAWHFFPRYLNSESNIFLNSFIIWADALLT